MASIPYMPFFFDAYWLDACHLSEHEQGCYLNLMRLAWSKPECRLPNDDAWLARHLQRTVEYVQQHYRPILAEFFQSDGNWLWQKRQQAEWRRAHQRHQKQSDNAKSRWKKEKDACRGNAVAMPTTPTSTDSKKEAPNGASKESASPEAPPKPKPQPTGSRIDPAWQPTLADIQFAQQEGLAHDDIRRESEQFRDYWLGQAGQRARKSDWAACWRNWVRRAAENIGRTAGRARSDGSGGGGNRREDRRQTGLLADTLAVLHRRRSMAGLFDDKPRMGRVPDWIHDQPSGFC